MLSGETANNNFIPIGWIWLGIVPNIYCTQCAHTNCYTADAVQQQVKWWKRKTRTTKQWGADF